MVWVLVGHSYSVIDSLAPSINEDQLNTDFQDGFLFRVVLNGYPSVDSFFIIGGCLLSYLLLKQLEKTNGKLNIPLFILHRYIRITGVYAVIIYANATIWKWTDRGPMTVTYIEEVIIQQ